MLIAPYQNAPAREPSTGKCLNLKARYAVSVTLLSPGEVSIGRPRSSPDATTNLSDHHQRQTKAPIIHRFGHHDVGVTRLWRVFERAQHNSSHTALRALLDETAAISFPSRRSRRRQRRTLPIGTNRPVQVVGCGVGLGADSGDFANLERNLRRARVADAATDDRQSAAAFSSEVGRAFVSAHSACAQ